MCALARVVRFQCKCLAMFCVLKMNIKLSRCCLANGQKGSWPSRALWRVRSYPDSTYATMYCLNSFDGPICRLCYGSIANRSFISRKYQAGMLTIDSECDPHHDRDRPYRISSVSLTPPVQVKKKRTVISRSYPCNSFCLSLSHMHP